MTNLNIQLRNVDNDQTCPKKCWRTFEKQICRICGPVYNKATGSCKRRFDKELYNMVDMTLVTSFIKDQKMNIVAWTHYEKRED